MSKISMLYCFFLIVLMSSCSTTGYFTSNPRDRMSFAGNEFILTKSDSFQLKRWTDSYSTEVDSDGNIIWKDRKYRGEGTYECKKDSLILNFSNNDSILVRINYVEDSISNIYDITFSNELGEPLWTQFQIMNSSQEVIKRIYFPENNNYILVIEKEEEPSSLKLTDFLSRRIDEPIIRIDNLELGENEIMIKSYNGYYAKDSRITIWFKPTVTGIRFQFDGKKKRWLPKRWRWKLINKLYKDY